MRRNLQTIPFGELRMKSGTSRLRLLAMAAAALSLSACVDDDQGLVNTPFPANGAIFARYIALGNSITAGYQSGGINDSTQARSYVPLLAAKAGITNFGIPSIARPGCPVPFVAPLTPATGATPSCARTAAGAQVNFVQNVAVPGARLLDILRVPGGQLGQLNTLLVGPRSQVRAMKQAQPTFVSVWVGNNDALEATLSGNLGPTPTRADSTLTPLATFQAQLAQLVDSIKATNPQGVMLVGVVDAVRSVPLIQPGAYFFVAAQATAGRFNGKLVNANCSPVNALGQPNPLSANMVSFQIVGDANFLEINCDPNAYAAGDPRRGVYLLDTAEQAIVRARVGTTAGGTASGGGYNAAIRAAADANGWLYVDPNLIFNVFLAESIAPPANTGTLRLFQRVRKCQLLPAATTPAALAEAVQKSCPNPAPVPAPNTTNVGAPGLFGSLFSFDGVHPSTEAHQLLAEYFARYINVKYGTTLATTITTLPT
jgi:lysophospholipase L1-like esterase